MLNSYASFMTNYLAHNADTRNYTQELLHTYVRIHKSKQIMMAKRAEESLMTTARAASWELPSYGLRAACILPRGTSYEKKRPKSKTNTRTIYSSINTTYGGIININGTRAVLQYLVRSISKIHR